MSSDPQILGAIDSDGRRQLSSAFSLRKTGESLAAILSENAGGVAVDYGRTVAEAPGVALNITAAGPIALDNCGQWFGRAELFGLGAPGSAWCENLTKLAARLPLYQVADNGVIFEQIALAGAVNLGEEEHYQRKLPAFRAHLQFVVDLAASDFTSDIDYAAQEQSLQAARLAKQRTLDLTAISTGVADYLAGDSELTPGHNLAVNQVIPEGFDLAGQLLLLGEAPTADYQLHEYYFGIKIQSPDAQKVYQNLHLWQSKLPQAVSLPFPLSDGGTLPVLALEQKGQSQYSWQSASGRNQMQGQLEIRLLLNVDNLSVK